MPYQYNKVPIPEKYVNESGNNISGWSFCKIYNKDDIVIYNGKIYMSLENNNGLTPGFFNSWSEIGGVTRNVRLTYSPNH